MPRSHTPSQTITKHHWRTVLYGLVCSLVLTIGGACQPEGSCASSTDCGGNQVCTNGTCRASGCQSNTDCLFGQECRDNACVSVTCTRHSQCKEDEFCNGGLCSKRPKVGETCAQKAIPCQQGLTCITLENRGKNVCFQDCSNDSTVCQKNTDKRTECLAFAIKNDGSTIRVCVGLADENQSCTYEGPSQTICKGGGYPPLYCDKQRGGRCLRATLRSGIRELCSGPSDNSEPYILCDETQGLYCDLESAECLETTKKVKESEACSLYGSSLFPPALCENPARCMTFNYNSTISRCAVECRLNEPADCAYDPKKVCTPFFQNGASLCLTKCNSDTDCQHKGYRCRTTPNQTKVCVPGFETGDIAFGALCSPLVSLQNCKPDLFCLKEADASSGTCSKTCTKDADCPTISVNGQSLPTTCTDINQSGDKACILHCEKGTCQEGHQCKQFGAPLCLAP